MSNSELDKTLIDLLRDQSNDIRNKNMIKLSEAKGFRKVAFDMFKDHYDGLWRLDSINGEDTLVRSSDPKYAYASGKNGWSASSDYDFRNITLCYKDIPIHRFSSQEFEFGEGDIGLFKSAILESVDEDGDFIKNILSNQPKSKLEALCSTFPEMTKFLK